jgi:hypothetical protein
MAQLPFGLSLTQKEVLQVADMSLGCRFVADWLGRDNTIITLSCCLDCKLSFTSIRFAAILVFGDETKNYEAY